MSAAHLRWWDTSESETAMWLRWLAARRRTRRALRRRSP